MCLRGEGGIGAITCSITLSIFPSEGDLHEDGLAIKNGFFRTRRFNHVDSERSSVDMFAEDRALDSDGEGGGEEEDVSSQAEAKRRRDRLEREEFVKKCRVRRICSDLFNYKLTVPAVNNLL